MKPHPRVRRSILWCGGVSSALLAAIWLGSGLLWVGKDLCDNGCWWSLTIGRFNVGYPGGKKLDSTPDLHLIWLPRYRMRWSLVWERAPAIAPLFRGAPRAAYWKLQLPLWIPTALTLIPTLLALRFEALARRRARLNHCPICGYDRAGIAKNAVCPECGDRPKVE